VRGIFSVSLSGFLDTWQKLKTEDRGIKSPGGRAARPKKNGFLQFLDCSIVELVDVINLVFCEGTILGSLVELSLYSQAEMDVHGVLGVH
jgi:hypothetical protein